MTEVKVQRASYGGWENCVRISNQTVDLVVTVDVGPRIIRYGFKGKENELCEVAAEMGAKGGDEWRIYGGHRLWHSPESKERTYEPDNFPVTWKAIANGIHTLQTVEPNTGIRKEMEITLSPESTAVTVVHRLTNKGISPMELAVWSITAMATGGKEVVPHMNKDTELLPNRIISLWPYTQLNDPRVYWGNKYITLRQRTDMRQWFKFGIPNEQGWAAYFNHGHLFVKHYPHVPDAPYPDFGVSYETFTNHFMLELETLSPLTVLATDAIAEHTERWELFENIPMPPDDEAQIEGILQGRVIFPSH